MNLNSHLLGDLLISMGIISQDQLDEALCRQKIFIDDALPGTDIDRTALISRGRRHLHPVPKLGNILVDMGVLTEEQLKPALDIQNRRALELRRLDSHKLATALEVGFIINSTVELVDVLSMIMKYANIVTDSAASTLMLLDEKTGELVFSVPTGPNADQLEDVRLPPGQGFAGWVAENEQYVLVEDAEQDERFYGAVDSMTGTSTQSVLCVPMKSKHKMIGVLEVINKKDGTSFTEDDAMLLSLFSHQAAIAIENAMLFNAMQERLEREKLLEQKVSESERLRSIGTLAGGIAHDFNNILGAIIGYTELAQMEVAPGGRTFANLAKVLGASRRARDLISQILTFSRQSDFESKPVQVNLIVSEALKLLRASLPKSVEIHEDMDCTSVIMGDSTQVHQVVMNLCTNAAHAMEKSGGRLGVSLEEVTRGGDGDEALPPLDISPGRYLKLSVTDTGTGMRPHVVERIFEPFYTTKEKGQGTGMGLAVVHGIVKSHGGDIHVSSVPGEGTVFDVFFPVVERTPEENDQNSFIGAVPEGDEHVLIVDDEAMLVDVSKARLNALGYKVSVETDSTQALNRFRQAPRDYDLVITDINMPVMGGDIMARQMKDIRPDIPIILCTGVDPDLSEETLRQKGFSMLLTKPTGFEELALAVRKVLDESGP